MAEPPRIRSAASSDTSRAVVPGWPTGGASAVPTARFSEEKPKVRSCAFAPSTTEDRYAGDKVEEQFAGYDEEEGDSDEDAWQLTGKD